MNVLKGRRYKGSAPFGDLDLDRRTFFGRDRESRSLHSLILAERLVVLFGKSGVGKTSLVNAGVLELVRQQGYFPIVVRLNDPEAQPLDALLESVESAAKAHRVDCVGGDRSSAWSFFKTAEFWSEKQDLLRPVLVLDQFEELFTLHTPEWRRRLISELAELVRGRTGSELAPTKSLIERGPPDLKLLISLREDFLADLEELSDDIPAILRSRFRLVPLSEEGAREAIVNPARLTAREFDTLPFSIREDAVEEILAFLAKQRRGDEAVRGREIEPFQLQLICQHLEERARRRQAQGESEIEITREEIGGEPQMRRILQGFYDRTVAAVKPGQQRRGTRRLCERRLISASGRRLTADQEEILRKFGISESRLRELVDARLLRAEARLGGIFYELSHDTLVEPIRESARRRAVRRRLRFGLALLYLLVTPALIVFVQPVVADAVEWLERFRQRRELFQRSGERAELDPESAGLASAGPARLAGAASEPPPAVRLSSIRAKFIAVDRGDDVRKADAKLVEYLNSMVSTVSFVLESSSHETAVERLANWSLGDPFLARLTPFVYLAARSLGAELVPLASYKSLATGDYTHRSYLVVRRVDVATDQPDSGDVIRLIAALNDEGLRARFRYHSRFSASSYYLPARFFLANRVFHMEKPVGSLLAIDSRQIKGDSSGDLVRMVASSGSPREGLAGADIVAVADDTRARFCREPHEDICSRLHFIPLDPVLPNDLLVASAAMSDWTRTQIQTAITTMTDREIDVADVARWEDIRQAHQARTALLALLREGRQARSKITIDVRADPDSRPPVFAWQKKAVEEAIELSGTEFTVWERYFHRKADFEWTLKLTRDGAMELASLPIGFRDAAEAAQTWIMSYEDEIDLIDRTTDFVASRMHRVRYIWPYWDKPTVIRDLPFALPEAGTRLRVARIVWEELDRNGYLTDPNDWFEARVVHSDFHKLWLDATAFPATPPRNAVVDLEFDPMSNVWYRVLLTRSTATTLRVVLTWFLSTVFVLLAELLILPAFLPGGLRGAFEMAGSS